MIRGSLRWAAFLYCQVLAGALESGERGGYLLADRSDQEVASAEGAATTVLDVFSLFPTKRLDWLVT